MLDLKGYGHTLLAGTVLTIEAALLSLAIAVILGGLGLLLCYRQRQWHVEGVYE